MVVNSLAISQHNASAVLGFRSGRAFREWVIAEGVPHIRRGKDRIVLAEVALKYLRPAEPAAAKPEEPVDECDRVLAIVGRRRA
jgi:hypothetical protein